MGAVNVIAPALGLNINYDEYIIYKMFSAIRETFGIDEDTESKLKEYDIIVPLANMVFQYATKEREGTLLKEIFKNIGKDEGKKFPERGDLVKFIEASAVYGIIWKIGNRYIDDCYDIAKRLMEKMIENEKKK